MIIDAHAHVMPDGKWFSTELDASPEALLRQMDEAQVDRAVILPVPGYHDNAFMLRTACNYSDRLMAAVALPPDENNVDGLQRWIDRGACMIKVYPKLQGLKQPEDLRDLFIFAVVNDVPVVVDTFNLPPGSINRWTPLGYDAIVSDMPCLKLILAHGGSFHVIETMELMRAHPMVYTDISYTPNYFSQSTSIWMDLQFFCQRFRGDRILWGSDFPEVRLKDSLQKVHKLINPLSDSAKDRILGRNTAVLFDLLPSS